MLDHDRGNGIPLLLGELVSLTRQRQRRHARRSFGKHPVDLSAQALDVDCRHPPETGYREWECSPAARSCLGDRSLALDQGRTFAPLPTDFEERQEIRLAIGMLLDLGPVQVVAETRFGRNLDTAIDHVAPGW